MKIVIGVTGNISSGKTTTARILEQHGCKVIDVDVLAKKILRKEPAIKRVFGTRNVKKLAEIVFSSKTNIQRINHIIHPKVIRAVKKIIKPSGIYVIDAPLLIEADMLKMIDYLILVRCKNNISKIRSNYDLRRKKYQLPFNQKILRAKNLNKKMFVVDNSRSLKHTEKQIKIIWRKINEDCRISRKF